MECVMNDKDYSLLRPFDLEAAKRGEPVLHIDRPSLRVRWVAIAGCGNSNIVEGPVFEGFALKVDYVPDECLRMAPLCWVEGRPAYKGDVLYYSDLGAWRKFEVQDSNQFGKDAPLFLENVPNEHGVGVGIGPDKLTWTPPTVKREGWINLYPCVYDGHAYNALASHSYRSKQEADARAGKDRLSCVRVEWEEPT